MRKGKPAKAPRKSGLKLGANLVRSVEATVRGSGTNSVPKDIPLDLIDVDSENPRRLRLEESEFLWLSSCYEEEDVNTDDFSSRESELYRIVELAKSISRDGLQQPIKTYLDGRRYRLAFGERRYWASRIIGAETITSNIEEKRPDNLRAIQFIENIQRDDLSFGRKVYSGYLAVEEEKERVGRALTSQEVSEVLGLSVRSARRYISVFESDPQLREAVFDDLLKGAREYELVKTLGPEKRGEVLDRLRKGASFKSLVDSGLIFEPQEQLEPNGEEPEPAASRKPRGRGRVKKFANLGRVKSPSVLEFIARKVLPPEEVQGLDFGDLASAEKAFKSVLKQIEKEVNSEG